MIYIVLDHSWGFFTATVRVGFFYCQHCHGWYLREDFHLIARAEEVAGSLQQECIRKRSDASGLPCRTPMTLLIPRLSTKRSTY